MGVVLKMSPMERAWEIIKAARRRLNFASRAPTRLEFDKALVNLTSPNRLGYCTITFAKAWTFFIAFKRDPSLAGLLILSRNERNSKRCLSPPHRDRLSCNDNEGKLAPAIEWHTQTNQRCRSCPPSSHRMTCRNYFHIVHIFP